MTDAAAVAADDPSLVLRAWCKFQPGGAVPLSVSDISASVSTNRVYRVVFDRGWEVIAKTSSYGSYVHFRQDHRLIQQWGRLLGGTRFASFLAHIIGPDGDVFTYREGERWVVFYEKAPFYDFLPKQLAEHQIVGLGRELAEFHKASAAAAPRMNPTWKSVGSDIAALHDSLGSRSWRLARGLADTDELALREHCELFLTQSEALGYHGMQKIPVLMDWNIGNFSVGLEQEGFKFFSRWDYDWFRIEPRMLDFYFAARVVRAEGDQSSFSYSAAPFLEPRFALFLAAYHEVSPLTEAELLFLKEVYRFFLLNYVLRSGEHFFRPSYCERLQKEAVKEHLPQMASLDLSPLLSIL